MTTEPRSSEWNPSETNVPESLSYQEALAEIESILARLEEESIPVDEVLLKVKRVAHLLAFCRDKLRVTEEEVQKVMDSLQV